MGAIISECGRYRTRLDRDVGGLIAGPTIGWMLHNPSTAGVENDDPTSRRGIGFTRRLGGSRLIFMNPWSGRATKPAELWQMVDPVGPTNDGDICAALEEISLSGGFVIAAWGKISPPVSWRGPAQARIAVVTEMIRAAGLKIFCLGTNLDGSPKHPLYVPGDAPLLPWPTPTPKENPDA